MHLTTDTPFPTHHAHRVGRISAGRRWPLAVFVVALPCTAIACSSDDEGESGTVITVSSTADACELSATSAPIGAVTFEVTNDGSETTEFYLYASDGSTIVGEVEDIGPGLTRDLRADLEAGSYVTACKPGMTGDGIRGEFTAAG